MTELVGNIDFFYQSRVPFEWNNCSANLNYVR